MTAKVDWRLHNLAMFRIVKPTKDNVTVTPLGHQSFFTPGQQALEELIDDWIGKAWKKKPTLNDVASCRVFELVDDSPDGDELLERALTASSKTFAKDAAALADRYALTQDSAAGDLMVLNATIDAGRCKDLPFLFLFPAEYQDVRQVTEERDLVPITEATGTKLTKGFVYPVWDGHEQNGEQIKFFKQGTDDIHTMLPVRAPATATEITERALKVALGSRFQDRFDDYFAGDAPKKRTLFDEGQYVPLNDLLPHDETKHATVVAAKNAAEAISKPIKTTITLDGLVKVELDLTSYGKNVFVAKKGGSRFVIVRGEHVTGSGPLMGLDFLEVPELDDILDVATDDTSTPEAGSEASAE